jgi:D-amino-acid oxidase
MNRRSFLQSSAALAGLSAVGLMGCAKKQVVASVPGAPSLPFYDAVGPVVPIRADVDRIFRITVCLRPFRAAGPRLDVERLGDKLVVHNYGHGGSGWSLSWGSADVVVRKALDGANGKRELAVIGCGALGMTAAITAQRAGFKVTIYAKERPPYVRSVRATGSWTPDSRIALASAAPPTFAALWESMARTSFAMYQSYLGTAGNPVEWNDWFYLRDEPPGQGAARMRPGVAHDFAHYYGRISELTPKAQDIPAGAHPFPTRYVRRDSSLTFNIAGYARQLMDDFMIAGGVIETREFHSPQDLGSLSQPVIINCPGYGARELWSDESIVPVRGQIAWLIPQEGVHYGLSYKGVNVLARRDGIVVQPTLGGEDEGWNDTNEQPDRAAAVAGVEVIRELYSRMETMPKSHST